MKITPMMIGVLTAAALSAPLATAQDEAAGSGDKYVLLSDTGTGKMEQKLNQAGARGYRFTEAQGRDDNGAVVVMTLDPDGRKYRYILLATLRVGTMQNEMNEAPPEFRYVGMMEFHGLGTEVAVVLEADLDDLVE